MIDIKKMLYRYLTYVEGERNALRSRSNTLARMNSGYIDRMKEYPGCVPSYNGDIMGKGGLPSSITERFALANAELNPDTMDDYNRHDKRAAAYREIINVIEGAVTTLDELQQKLIKEKYFNGRTVDMTANMMDVGIRAYWNHHKNAMEGLEVALNGGDIEFMMPHLVPQRTDKIAVKYAVNRISNVVKTAV